VSSTRAVALLVTHGALGLELVRTAESILGSQDDVLTLGNEGLSGDQLTAAIEARIRDLPVGRPVVVFTDLAAGSCGIASRRATSDARVVRRITGVNLPMLLEFFHYRDTVPLDDLLPRLEAKGKAGIVVL
jgi:mannose PTS system EIIA component